jgi:hypothetical protein
VVGAAALDGIDLLGDSRTWLILTSLLAEAMASLFRLRESCS